MWPPSSTGSEKSISRYPFEACLFVFLTELTTSRWQHIYANWGIFLTHLIFFKPVTTDQMRLSYESQCSELGGTVPHTFKAFIFMWGAECYIRSEHCFTSLFLLTGPDNKNKGPPAGYCGMSGRTAVWYQQVADTHTPCYPVRGQISPIHDHNTVIHTASWLHAAAN